VTVIVFALFVLEIIFFAPFFKYHLLITFNKFDNSCFIFSCTLVYKHLLLIIFLSALLLLQCCHILTIQ